MANNVVISPFICAPYGVWPASTAWALASAFQTTGSGSGWAVGADLGPTAYADNGSGLVRVTMASTATLATGNHVYITGTTAAVYDGYWIVTVIDATNIDLQASTYSVNPAAKGTLKETIRYNWLVVGWKTASESDLNNAFALNTVRSDYGYGSTDAVVYENGANGLRPINATDELYLTWTLPARVKFNHISVYFQTSDTTSSYDPTILASKVLPSSANFVTLYGAALEGNIPGWATRVIISSPTAHTYTRQVPVMDKDLANNIVTIFGDYRHCLADGSSLVLLDSGGDSGATTVSGAPTVDYTSDGQVTLITVAANIADATLGTLQYNEGPFKPIGISVDTCTLSIIEDTQPQFRALAELAYNGNTIDVDNLNDCPLDALTLAVPVTSFASPDDAYLLNKWLQARIYVRIIYTNDSGAIVYPHIWYGRIIGVPHTGGIRKHASGSIGLQFLIDRQVNYREDLKWYGIASATASTNAITLHGDVRRWIGAGTPLYIKNSTGNDGLWVCSSSSYSASADLTTVTMTGNLPDDTDDGYVEIYDW